MIVSALRGLVSLAVDAAECLLVLGTSGYARVDELWADTRKPFECCLCHKQGHGYQASQLCFDCADRLLIHPGVADVVRVYSQSSSAVAEERPASGSSAASVVSGPPSCVDNWLGNRVTDRPDAGHPTPPAAGVAPNPAAGAAPPSPSFPTAGHPNITDDEWDAAAFVLRRYARNSFFDDYPATRARYRQIADKLDPAKR